MKSKEEFRELPDLVSWTQQLNFEWQKQRFEAWVVCLQSNNLTSIRLQRLASQLPREELAALSANAIFSRQRDYVLGRLAARKAVGAALGGPNLDPMGDSSCLRILPGVFTQPVLTAIGPASRLGVSISHRDGCAVALAVDRKHPMALDLERIDPEQTTVFAPFMDLQERKTFQTALPSLSDIEQRCLLWTCKEALGKAMGCGLTVPPEFLAVAGAASGVPMTLPQGSIAGVRGSYRHCPQFAWHAWKLTDRWLTIAAPEQSRLVNCIWKSAPFE